jgi:hypothetical protein
VPWSTGPLLAAALLLAAAGTGKLLRPAGTTAALRAAGLPGGAPGVRVLGCAELAIGCAAVTSGSWPPRVLLAASYLGFTGYVLLARARSGRAVPCGCFGRSGGRLTRGHAALTAGCAAVVGAAAATGGSAAALHRVAAQPADGLLVLAFAGVAGWLGYLVLAVLPELSPAAVAAEVP